MSDSGTITFIDSGVLIAAARGASELHQQAMVILDDPDRSFASSPFVRLEVLPKAKFEQRRAEVEFYEAFFESVNYWVQDLERVVEGAHTEAERAGLSAMDALHVSAAILLDVGELVTTERISKPIHRTKSIRVRTIHAG